MVCCTLGKTLSIRVLFCHVASTYTQFRVGFSGAYTLIVLYSPRPSHGKCCLKCTS